MDIDNFLDKEVPAKKEGDGEAFVTQASAEFRGAEASNSLAAGKTGNLEALEKNYSEMWGRISKDKFSWSSGLYEGISKTGDEIITRKQA